MKPYEIKLLDEGPISQSQALLFNTMWCEWQDIKKIKESNCDVLFFPNFNEIYPKKVKINKIVKKYRNIMCDIYRPKHFDGVTTVVNILFSIIPLNPNIIVE